MGRTARKKSDKPGYAICTKCNQDLLEVDNFHVNRTREDGSRIYKSQCKHCIEKKRYESVQGEKSRSNPTTPAKMRDPQATPWLTESSNKPWERLDELDSKIIKQVSHHEINIIKDNSNTNNIVTNNDQVNRDPLVMNAMNDPKLEDKLSKESEIINTFDYSNGPSKDYQTKDDSEIIYFPTDDDIIQPDYTKSFKKEEKEQQQYQPQSEALINKRRELLEKCQVYPAIAKALKLSPAKIFQMNNIQTIENALLNFKSTSTIQTLTTYIKYGIVALSQVIETTFTNTTFSKWFYLTDYSKVVDQDPEIDEISKELACEYSENLSDYCTPEAKLVLILTKDALSTHNAWAKYYGERQTKIISPKNNESPTQPYKPESGTGPDSGIAHDSGITSKPESIGGLNPIERG